VGIAVFLLSTLAAIFVLLRLLRGLSFRGRGRRIVVVGIGIWLVTAINDLMGTLNVPVPHFLMEYGFLSFLVALLSLVMSEHLRLHQVVLRQHRQIRESRTALARLVNERTKELRREVAEHLQTEDTLRRSMADREVLIREIHHRGKNNLQIVSSLLRLAFEGIAAPDVARIVQESQDRIGAMAMVHEQLYGSDALSQVDFAEYLRGLTSHLSGIHGPPGYEVEVDFRAEPIRLPIDRAVPLGLWANEAITNSFRHAFGPARRGTLTVRLDLLDRETRLTVGDNGPGVPGDHEIVQGPTGGAEGRLHLGAYLIHDLPKQIGGRLEVKCDSGL
jgi:two-component sensor histidine kinase